MDSLVLEVWSDVVCPWCYIGRTRLKKALAALGRPAEVRWRAFELQPDLPAAGVEARPFYAQKFGGAQRVEQIFARTAQVAAQDGLQLRFDRIQRAPNTRLAHRAIKLAKDPDAAVGALFKAHFEEGLDVADPAVVERLTGVTLQADAALADVLQDEQLAADYGIGGVPFFVANGRLALSGAQPAEVFEGFLKEAALPAERGADQR